MRTRYCKDRREQAAFVLFVIMPRICHFGARTRLCLFSTICIISIDSYSEDLVESWISCLLFHRCFPLSQVSFVRNQVAFYIPFKAGKTHAPYILPCVVNLVTVSGKNVYSHSCTFHTTVICRLDTCSKTCRQFALFMHRVQFVKHRESTGILRPSNFLFLLLHCLLLISYPCFNPHSTIKQSKCATR